MARKLGRQEMARYPWTGSFPPTAKAGNFADASIADTLANVVPDYNDGSRGSAPVGSFGGFDSPYGVSDLAGNVAEWTQEWYTTTYHAGLDGIRILRGGSWMAVPVACDAVTGATKMPVKESAVIGFRGVYVPF